MMDYVDVIGCNFRHRLYDHNGSHYSGNFWWARSDYLKNMEIHSLVGKYDAEFCLFKNNPTFAHIHKCPHGHYEQYYAPSSYQKIVDNKVISIINMLSEIKSMPILYGIEDRYIDITSICHSTLITNGIIDIPAGDNERNAIFGDPIPGTVKHIRIGDLTFPFQENIRIPF